MLGGVCGGLGASTPIPSWIWRAGFLVSLLFFGTGGLVYIILWIALPEQQPQIASTNRQPAMNHLLIRHKVNDFAKWKAAYDAHAPARDSAGLKEIHLLRNVNSLDEIVLMYEVTDLAKAQEFVGSTDLQTAMQSAGVMDKPDIYFLT